MEYILIDKETEKEENITKEKAIKIISWNYRNAEYILDNAERLFNNRIVLEFAILIIK
jgi:hypothetical protein